MANVKMVQGDCLELMKDIPDGSVDMILCDLPYGTAPARDRVSLRHLCGALKNKGFEKSSEI